MDREELIKICEDAVVPFLDWNNRDSYAAQEQLADIYKLLSAKVAYTVNIEDNHTIYIDFINVTKEQIEKSNQFYLHTDSIDDYKEAFPDNEMFIGYGLGIPSIYDISSFETKYIDDVNNLDNVIEMITVKKRLGGYLPTRSILIEYVEKYGDWY